MKHNYFSLTAKTAIAAVVLAAGAGISAQAQYIPVQEFDLNPTGLLRTTHTGKAQQARNVAGTVTASQAALPKFQNRPQSIMRSAEAPRGNVYGVTNRYTALETADQAYLGSINLTTGAFTPQFYNRAFNKMGDDYSMQSVTYRKGEVVVPQLDMEGYTEVKGVVWHTFDLATGAETGTHEFKDLVADPYCVTYDPDKDLFYLVSFENNTGAHSMFGIVDPNAEGGWKYLSGPKLTDSSGSNQPYIPAIAYNPADKQIYAFDNKWGVYTIEYEMHPSGSLVDDAILIEAGETSCEDLDNPYLFDGDPDYGIINGAVTYSPMDEMFVSIFRDNILQGNRILFIHPETFEAFVGPTMKPQDRFINGIFCIDEMADPDAPELAAEPQPSFDKQSLSGEIAFTVPGVTFVGVDLEGAPLECVAVIDGKEVDRRSVKAGSSYTLPITLEQGLHRLEFTTSNNGNVSPTRTIAFYTGYDAPVAPKNIDIAANVITWDACANAGYHNGYVDMADLGYNIYLDGVKQNDAPVKATTFTLNVPDLMKRYDIGVAGVSQGQESPLTVINPIFGKAFTLPFQQTPTREEAVCFDFYNENGDAAIFKYGINNGVNPGLSFQCGYFYDADDWVILPLVNLPSKDSLYEFAFTLRGHNTDYSNEAYEIYVAKRPEPEYMLQGLQVYSSPEEKAHGLIPAEKSYTFAVPEAGDYYVGLHVTSTRAQSSLGVFLSDFRVRSLDGASSEVPGKLTDVKLVPGDFGEPEATATVVLPTVDMLGRPLAADDEITLTMAYYDEKGEPQGVSTTGKPGETVTITHVSPKDGGFVIYAFTPSNKNGKGFTTSYSVYVGIDTPLCPTNIVGVPTDDNMGMHLTWDSSGEVGANGGFVDLESPDFTYTIYTKESITLHKIEDTKETEYTFYPYGQATRGTLARFNVGPVAKNIVGQSQGSLFIADDLGTPYELPMKENFNTTKFNYNPYTFDKSGRYAASTWENSNNLIGLGFNEVTDGVLLGYSEGGPCLAKANLPKFTTSGLKKTILQLRYLDYNHAPKSVQVYARSNKNNEEIFAGEITFNNPARAEWAEAEISLPEALEDCSWVQLRIATSFLGLMDEYLVIEDYTIMPDADYDLKVSEFDGRTEATLGDDVSYNVVVANSGRERVNGKLRVEMVAPDGTVLATKGTDIENLNSSQTSDFTADFNIGGDFAPYKSVKVRAVIDADDDNLNNNVKELTLNLKNSALPMVTDLNAVVKNGKVELSWSPASAEYGDFENFEAYKPFDVADSFDYWQNYDGDDLWPGLFQNQTTGTPVRWENDNKKMGWQVYDWREMYNTTADGTTITTPAYIERLKPHSGNQALIARTAGYGDDEEPVATSKWLVSPLLKAGSAFSFYYTTLDSGTTEYIEIWTCEKENGVLNPTDKNVNLGRAGDFKKVASKSKNGAEVWELVNHTLSRREVYFALRYVSYDGYAAAIDDLAFVPAEMLSRQAESYSVYRADANGENPVCIADHITGTSFTDADWNDTDATYYVVAHSKVDEYLRDSAPSNTVFIGSSAVGEITAAQKVTAGHGTITVEGFGGQPIAIAATDGKVVAGGRVNSHHHTYAVDKGIYLVTIGSQTYKVVVK